MTPKRKLPPASPEEDARARERWPIAGDLLAVLRLGVTRGYVTPRDVSMLCPRKRTEPGRWLAEWSLPRRGWFTKVARGRYEPTARGVRRVDVMEELSADAACGLRPSVAAVRGLARRRGVVRPSDVVALIGCSPASAYTLLSRWARQGLLKRSHIGSYRLPDGEKPRIKARADVLRMALSAD